MFEPAFWVGLGQIIFVNILLSGDNAVVIALASRSLPPKQMKMAILAGSGLAVVLRVIFTLFVVYLMQIPYLKLVGSVLLLYVAVNLLNEDDGEDDIASHGTLWAAIRTIVLADLVMSLDNVIAIAAVAHDDYTLLILGLLISMPLIIFGSTIVLKLLQTFPILVTGGGGLLGWVAGDIGVSDPAVQPWVLANAPHLELIAPIVGALFVVALGTWLSRRSKAKAEAKAG
jgi:YjbE family integral membrane protein